MFHVFSLISLIHLIYSLTVRVVGAPQMISQPVSSIFPCSPLPSGTWRTPDLSSLMLSSHLFLCPSCLLHPFTVPCKMVLARPNERETRPYHCSLRQFTIVRRSSCGLIACWKHQLHNGKTHPYHCVFHAKGQEPCQYCSLVLRGNEVETITNGCFRSNS